jgi:hypothetical protein
MGTAKMAIKKLSVKGRSKNMGITGKLKINTPINMLLTSTLSMPPPHLADK